MSAFAVDVAMGLSTQWLGHAHLHHASIGSTNDDAAAWGEDGAPHGALVTADAQTSGRGRFGRAWHSPAGAHVYASVVLRPETADARWAALGLAVGVGLREGLSQWCDAIGLKWPNDLVVGDRKLAGILCEAKWGSGAPQIVVGFGINVRRVAWPEELRAVSLGDLGADVSPSSVLVSVLNALEPVLDVFAKDGFAAVRSRYAAACVSLGRDVVVSRAGGERATVFAEGLDQDGALLVRDGGALVRVDGGELSAPESP